MEALLEAVPDRLTTARLLLRCARSEDAPALNAAVCESFEQLRHYIPWATAVPTLERSEADCRRSQARFLLREDLTLLMFERLADGLEGELIGGCGLHRIDWDVRRFEVGYWCRTRRTGEGFVTEAVRAVTRMAFDRLRARRVELRVDDRNRASWRVAERTGFTLEGVLRGQSLSPQGELCDIRVYACVTTAPPFAAPGALSFG